jgi:hypothetical protein
MSHQGHLILCGPKLKGRISKLKGESTIVLSIHEFLNKSPPEGVSYASVAIMKHTSRLITENRNLPEYEESMRHLFTAVRKVTASVCVYNCNFLKYPFVKEMMERINGDLKFDSILMTSDVSGSKDGGTKKNWKLDNALNADNELVVLSETEGLDEIDRYFADVTQVTLKLDASDFGLTLEEAEPMWNAALKSIIETVDCRTEIQDLMLFFSRIDEDWARDIIKDPAKLFRHLCAYCNEVNEFNNDSAADFVPQHTKQRMEDTTDDDNGTHGGGMYEANMDFIGNDRSIDRSRPMYVNYVVDVLLTYFDYTIDSEVCAELFNKQFKNKAVKQLVSFEASEISLAYDFPTYDEASEDTTYVSIPDIGGTSFRTWKTTYTRDARNTSPENPPINNVGLLFDLVASGDLTTSSYKKLLNLLTTAQQYNVEYLFHLKMHSQLLYGLDLCETDQTDTFDYMKMQTMLDKYSNGFSQNHAEMPIGGSLKSTGDTSIFIEGYAPDPILITDSVEQVLRYKNARSNIVIAASSIHFNDLQKEYWLVLRFPKQTGAIEVETTLHVRSWARKATDTDTIRKKYTTHALYNKTWFLNGDAEGDAASYEYIYLQVPREQVYNSSYETVLTCNGLDGLGPYFNVFLYKAFENKRMPSGKVLSVQNETEISLNRTKSEDDSAVWSTYVGISEACKNHCMKKRDEILDKMIELYPNPATVNKKYLMRTSSSGDLYIIKGNEFVRSKADGNPITGISGNDYKVVCRVSLDNTITYSPTINFDDGATYNVVDYHNIKNTFNAEKYRVPVTELAENYDEFKSYINTDLTLLEYMPNPIDNYDVDFTSSTSSIRVSDIPYECNYVVCTIQLDDPDVLGVLFSKYYVDDNGNLIPLEVKTEHCKATGGNPNIIKVGFKTTGSSEYRINAPIGDGSFTILSIDAYELTDDYQKTLALKQRFWPHIYKMLSVMHYELITNNDPVTPKGSETTNVLNLLYGASISNDVRKITYMKPMEVGHVSGTYNVAMIDDDDDDSIPEMKVWANNQYSNFMTVILSNDRTDANIINAFLFSVNLATMTYTNFEGDVLSTADAVDILNKKIDDLSSDDSYSVYGGRRNFGQAVENMGIDSWEKNLAFETGVFAAVGALSVVVDSVVGRRMTHKLTSQAQQHLLDAATVNATPSSKPATFSSKRTAVFGLSQTADEVSEQASKIKKLENPKIGKASTSFFVMVDVAFCALEAVELHQFLTSGDDDDIQSAKNTFYEKYKLLAWWMDCSHIKKSGLNMYSPVDAFNSINESSDFNEAFNSPLKTYKEIQSAFSDTRDNWNAHKKWRIVSMVITALLTAISVFAAICVAIGTGGAGSVLAPAIIGYGIAIGGTFAGALVMGAIGITATVLIGIQIDNVFEDAGLNITTAVKSISETLNITTDMLSNPLNMYEIELIIPEYNVQIHTVPAKHLYIKNMTYYSTSWSNKIDSVRAKLAEYKYAPMDDYIPTEQAQPVLPEDTSQQLTVLVNSVHSDNIFYDLSGTVIYVKIDTFQDHENFKNAYHYLYNDSLITTPDYYKITLTDDVIHVSPLYDSATGTLHHMKPTPFIVNEPIYSVIYDISGIELPDNVVECHWNEIAGNGDSGDVDPYIDIQSIDWDSVTTEPLSPVGPLKTIKNYFLKCYDANVANFRDVVDLEYIFVLNKLTSVDSDVKKAGAFLLAGLYHHSGIHTVVSPNLSTVVNSPTYTTSLYFTSSETLDDIPRGIGAMTGVCIGGGGGGGGGAGDMNASLGQDHIFFGELGGNGGDGGMNKIDINSSAVKLDITVGAGGSGGGKGTDKKSGTKKTLYPATTNHGSDGGGGGDSSVAVYTDTNSTPLRTTGHGGGGGGRGRANRPQGRRGYGSSDRVDKGNIIWEGESDTVLAGKRETPGHRGTHEFYTRTKHQGTKGVDGASSDKHVESGGLGGESTCDGRNGRDGFVRLDCDIYTTDCTISVHEYNSESRPKRLYVAKDDILFITCIGGGGGGGGCGGDMVATHGQAHIMYGEHGGRGGNGYIQSTIYQCTTAGLLEITIGNGGDGGGRGTNRSKASGIKITSSSSYHGGDGEDGFATKVKFGQKVLLEVNGGSGGGGGQAQNVHRDYGAASCDMIDASNNQIIWCGTNSGIEPRHRALGGHRVGDITHHKNRFHRGYRGAGCDRYDTFQYGGGGYGGYNRPDEPLNSVIGKSGYCEIIRLSKVNNNPPKLSNDKLSAKLSGASKNPPKSSNDNLIELTPCLMM